MIVCKEADATIWAYITDSQGNKVVTFEDATCQWDAKAKRYQRLYTYVIPTDNTLAINTAYQFTVQAGYLADEDDDYNYQNEPTIATLAHLALLIMAVVVQHMLNVVHQVNAPQLVHASPHNMAWHGTLAVVGVPLWL